MIGLLAKNKRAQPLFRQLTSNSAHFVDLGVAVTSSAARGAAGLSSISFAGLAAIKMDAQFSPFRCNSLYRSCERLIGRSSDITGVLYWGATNQPTRKFPYCIITDGPFDPGDPSYPAEWRPRRWASNYLARQRKVYREAAHIFTLSNWAADKIEKVHGVTRENLTVVGWGPMHFCSAPTLLPKNGDYFVSVGSQWKRKGMDILASAADILHTSHPEATVVLAGDPAGLEVKPRPGLNLIPTAITGERAQDLISNARALLVGSRFDASPHVIMEAFQAGTPVIASRVCGIPEAVTAETGYLVDAGDVAGFANAMRSCLDSDMHTQRQRVYEHYKTTMGGWDKVADRIVSTVERLAGF